MAFSKSDGPEKFGPSGRFAPAIGHRNDIRVTVSPENCAPALQLYLPERSNSTLRHLAARVSST
jgi:hypothetical protein